MGVFLMLLGLTGVEEGEGCIKAIALAGSDEVIDVEVIGVLATGACVEIQFSQLDVAAERKGVLHALNCPVDGGCFGKNVF
jgi:hypothetical protein